MANIYYVKQNEIEKIQTYATWEDAYIYLTDFAVKNGFEMRFNRAVKEETKEVIYLNQNSI